MEDIKTTYIPVGQAVRTNYKTEKIGRIIKQYKIQLIIGTTSIVLLTSYVYLITSFINLIRILN